MSIFSFSYFICFNFNDSIHFKLIFKYRMKTKKGKNNREIFESDIVCYHNVNVNIYMMLCTALTTMCNYIFVGMFCIENIEDPLT